MKLKLHLWYSAIWVARVASADGAREDRQQKWLELVAVTRKSLENEAAAMLTEMSWGNRSNDWRITQVAWF